MSLVAAVSFSQQITSCYYSCQ